MKLIELFYVLQIRKAEENLKIIVTQFLRPQESATRDMILSAITFRWLIVFKSSVRKKSRKRRQSAKNLLK